MRLSFLFHLILVPVLQASRPQCGVAPRRMAVRIEGGIFADSNDFPWMVSIQGIFNNRFEHHCGGTLITPQVVLTAAHCLSWYESVVRKGGTLRVVIGCNYHSRISQHCHVQEFSIDDWINHEDYYEHWKNFQHDIAIIRLSKNVTGLQGSSPIPICMPHPDIDEYFGPCTIAGWGLDNPYLEVTEIRVLPAKNCSNYKTAFVKKNMICAGDERGVSDACQGDSGGPLMVRRYTTFFQMGIVSGGKGCALKGWNGIYTKVSRYVRWIEKHSHGYGQMQFMPGPRPRSPNTPAPGPHRRQLPVSEQLDHSLPATGRGVYLFGDQEQGLRVQVR